MKNYDVVINHKGRVDLDTIDSILHKLKVYLNHKIDDKILRKRVYTLSVECLENIFRHADLKDEKEILVLNYPPRLLLKKYVKILLFILGILF